MRIEKNSVVSLEYELFDAAGNFLEKSDSPVSYLHGGYDGIFPQVEEALHGQSVGYSCKVNMDPENSFGEIEPELIREEPRSLFPADVEVGMAFEGGEGDFDENDEDVLVFTVTKVTPDTVTVDGNHPFAGKHLVFSCNVTAVRPATEEEIAHGHIHDDDHHH